jgi:hypothetical protein
MCRSLERAHSIYVTPSKFIAHFFYKFCKKTIQGKCQQIYQVKSHQDVLLGNKCKWRVCDRTSLLIRVIDGVHTNAFHITVTITGKMLQSNLLTPQRKWNKINKKIKGSFWNTTTPAAISPCGTTLKPTSKSQRRKNSNSMTTTNKFFVFTFVLHEQGREKQSQASLAVKKNFYRSRLPLFEFGTTTNWVPLYRTCKTMSRW